MQVQEFFLKVFLSICVILPTGSIFDINVKFISLFMLLAIAAINDGKGLFKIIVGMIPPLFLISGFSLITLYYGKYTDESIAQTKDIAVFFLMTTLGYSLLSKERRGEVVVGIITNSLIFLGLVKIFILGYAFATGGSVASVVKGLSLFFNTSLMTMESDDVAISRINFMSDYLIPAALYLITREAITQRKSTKTNIILVILMISLIISLSRFLWGVGFLSILLAIFSNLRKFKSLLIIFVMICVATFLLSLQSVQDLIAFRFTSKDASVSDMTRTLQYNGIMDHFWDAPLLGNGIGYYIPDLIRSYLSRYSYELQIPALFMQIGIIGSIIFFLIISATLYNSARILNFRMKVIYFVLVLIWLAGGFFNPVIISSTGGVAFLFLYAIPFRFKEQR